MNEMPIPCGAFVKDDPFKSESRPCPNPARWLIEDIGIDDKPLRRYTCDEHRQRFGQNSTVREVIEVRP